MNTSVLRHAVEAARREEQRSGQLRRWVAWRLPHLDRALQLPRREPETALWEFGNAYVGQLPGYLETTRRLALELGVERLAAPVIKLAGDSFLSVSAPRQPASLLDLLHVAYLSHRLVEEVNDYCVSRLGGPHLPRDMTLANLICHHLLGETFANELDSEILRAADRWLAGRPLPAGTARCRRPVQWPPPPISITLAWPLGPGCS